jgi:glucokinase
MVGAHVSAHSNHAEGLPAAAHAGAVADAYVAIPTCGCGNRGDIEAVSSGSGLARRWGKPVADLFEAADRGDARAQTLINDALEHVSALIYNLIITLDLERIAVGGGLFHAQQNRLLPALRDKVFNHPSRCGLGALTADVDIQAVHNARHTADLAALCLVMPDSWQDEGILEWEALQ